MSYGWNQKPTRLELRTWMNGDPTFELGAYMITIHHPAITPDAPPEISYVRTNRSENTDPRQTFPNMDVSDGVLRIPVEDIVDHMLDRLDPKDLARALWTKDQSVCDEFMLCMVSAYADGSLSDTDRRTFLREVKEAVHDASVGALAALFTESEWRLANHVHFWDQVRGANQLLEDAEKKVRHYLGQPEYPTEEQTEVFKLKRISDGSQDPLTRIGGTVWNECRDWWRTQCRALFPGPEKPVEGGDGS